MEQLTLGKMPLGTAITTTTMQGDRMWVDKDHTHNSAFCSGFLYPVACFILLLLLQTSAQAALIQRTITIDGNISDWTTAPDITFNSGQYAEDGDGRSCPSSDRDAQPDPIDATTCTTLLAGRDLRKFAFTWDDSNLYLYIERFANSTNVTDWWFYIDTNADGYLQNGEPVLGVSWQGSNQSTDRTLYQYVAVDGVNGDPLTGPPAGSADGYTMPGAITNAIALGSVNGGHVSGERMETWIAWSDLGSTGPSSLRFHIASANGTNLPNAIVDNMDGPGGAGGAIIFLDLAVSKSASVSTISSGGSFSYTVTVSSLGTGDASEVSLDDVLPTGVTYVSDNAAASGTSYDSASGKWTIGNLAGGASVSLVINVQAGVVLTDTAVVNTANNLQLLDADTLSTNNQASATVTITPAAGPLSDLSSSTISAQDLNGGNVEAGDVIRYSINLVESAGYEAPNVSVSADIHSVLGSLGVITLPTSAVDNSTGVGTGANGTGFLDISNITVPANGSALMRFDVTLAAATPVGSSFNITANVVNPSGLGTLLVSPSLVVTDTVITKQLYVQDAASASLSRTPSTSTTPITIAGNGGSLSWNMTPTTQTPLTLAAGSIAIPLWVQRGTAGPNRDIMVTLSYSGAASGTIGSHSITMSTLGPALNTFSINLPTDLTLPVGTSLILNVTNTTANASRSIDIIPLNAGVNSRVDLNSRTLIKVESVSLYDAPYPGGIAITGSKPTAQVSIRALLSDPFGSYDISAATISLLRPDGSVALADAPMNLSLDSLAADKQFEYLYTLPLQTGVWTALVTAYEGSEGTVTHTQSLTWAVSWPPPQITMLKAAVPANAQSGDIVTYTIQLTNNISAGPADAIVLSDRIHDFLSLAIDQGAGHPFFFTDSVPPSGLSLGTPTYSDDDGLSYLYTLSSGAGGANSGFDAVITNWLLPMSGSLQPGGSITIQYQTQLQ